MELRGARIPNPLFYAEAKALGFTNFPQFQFQVLGLERYLDLFVRGLIKTQLHVTVPLEAQAFLLESRFQEDRTQKFPVEDQVRLWICEGPY